MTVVILDPYPAKKSPGTCNLKPTKKNLGIKKTFKRSPNSMVIHTGVRITFPTASDRETLKGGENVLKPTQYLSNQTGPKSFGNYRVYKLNLHNLTVLGIVRRILKTVKNYGPSTGT